MKRIDPLGLLLCAIAWAFLSCSGGGNLADNGGMSGTGISQGAISAFGSIFVNGVEWDVDDAEIEIDGRRGSQTDLRVGMVVRVEGDRAGGASGTALSVVFDDALEGPIADDPVDVNPSGKRKQFSVLGIPVIVDIEHTHFGGGANFDNLVRDQVVEISGFALGNGTIRATRLELRGSFPDRSEAELRGRVSNLFKGPNGSGVFDLGSVFVRYDGTTTFEDGTRAELANGVLVEVEGNLRVSGDELDAARIELEDEGFGDEDFDDVEVEGFVTGFVSNASFVVAGVPVDATTAEFEPASLVLADGVQVEVEGRLEAGVLVADKVEGEGDDDEDEDDARVKIRAAVSAVSTNPNRLTLLDVNVSVDADSELEDERDDLPNFRFQDIQVGDWLEIEAVDTGAGTARALQVERDDADDDVVLQGPVTSLDVDAPALQVLGQAIPLDALTRYFDDENERSEEEFFRNPGDVEVGDTVKVTDQSASDLAALIEADEVEIENEDD